MTQRTAIWDNGHSVSTLSTETRVPAGLSVIFQTHSFLCPSFSGRAFSASPPLNPTDYVTRYGDVAITRIWVLLLIAALPFRISDPPATRVRRGSLPARLGRSDKSSPPAANCRFPVIISIHACAVRCMAGADAKPFSGRQLAALSGYFPLPPHPRTCR